MPASKSERLINLVILLLVSNTFVTKERIRELTEPYRNCASDEAFEKMFERDKEELRSLGIPIEVGYVDRFFEDEQGYRIARDAFELPAIDFTPDEAAVLGVAARVWQHAGLAAATSDALVKLKAGGHDVDRAAIDTVRPTLVAEEPAFDAMWQATLHHAPVTFDYRRPGASSASERHLEPWGVVFARDRWYVVGLDLDRSEPRMFRLGRVLGTVSVGRPGSFTVPEGTDLRALSQSLEPARPDHEATVLVRTDAALGLRRRAQLEETAVLGPDGRTDWDRMTVRYAAASQLAADVLEHAGSVVALAPEELREEITSRLRELGEAQAS